MLFIFSMDQAYVCCKGAGILRRKWRYRKPYALQRKPLSVRKVFFYSFMLFLICNVISLWVVDQAITPTIKDIAQTEIRRITTEAIDEAVLENITKKVPGDSLIIERKREGLEPVYSFDAQVYNMALAMTTKDIETRLGIKHNSGFSNGNINDVKDAQLESIVYRIPLGVVTGLTLLSNIGPEIPVELALVRDVESKFRTQMINGGINNTYFELYIDIEVDIQIVIPFFTDEEPIKYEALIGTLYIPGKVPTYFGSGGSLPPPAIAK